MAHFCKCHKCGSDLRGPTIHVDSRHYYGYKEDEPCEACGKEPHFSRLVGLYDYGVDRTIAWRCPDCGYVEERRD